MTGIGQIMEKDKDKFEIYPKPIYVLPFWNAQQIYDFIKTVANCNLEKGMINFVLDGKKVSLVINIEKERP